MRSTSFAPGLLFSTGPGFVNKSALDLAAAAIAPDGLGLLAPLYQLLYGFLKRHANIDIQSITRKAVIAFGAAVGIRLLWTYAKPLFEEYFTSSITLPIEHQTAEGIQNWINRQEGSIAKRHLKYTVSAAKFNIATQSEDLVGEIRTNITGGFFMFEKRPLYISYNCDKHVKISDREMVKGIYDESSDDIPEVMLSGDSVTVRALMDKSGDLLKRFTEAVAAKEVREIKHTPVYTVGFTSQMWNMRLKPIRPLHTIDLDAQVKAGLLNDIERFLTPGRANWYGARGIPYRRGFGLWGPPGTGKSSLSQALAGHIGGPLYQIELGQVSNEKRLVELFQTVGEGSIILLEDVDSAGIVREKMCTSESTPALSSMDRNSSRRGEGKSPITLSGLLNAIDELNDGVILLMTSNYPDLLDSALIRPGRIDKQIYIGPASQSVAASIFTRFYSDDDETYDSWSSADHHERIAKQAKKFAEKIPDLKLTPAEIQGYLIPLSDDPDQALAGADKFVSDLLAAKVDKVVDKNLDTKEAKEENVDESGSEDSD